MNTPFKRADAINWFARAVGAARSVLGRPGRRSVNTAAAWIALAENNAFEAIALAKKAADDEDRSENISRWRTVFRPPRPARCARFPRTGPKRFEVVIKRSGLTSAVRVVKDVGAMSNKNKQTPLVTSVLALQEHLSELERVGGKINSEDLSGDFDVEYIQKLLARFAECGQRIADEMTNFSAQLQEAQTRAETITAGVSRQAVLFKQGADDRNEKLEKFRLLGERVRELNTAIAQFRPPQGDVRTDEDRMAMNSNIATLDSQLAGVIEELRELRNSMRGSRMKTLEKEAESLAQSLQALQVKLRNVTQ
jgi:hypothetical protein